MPEWPGTPVQSAAAPPAWPGTPVKATEAQQWPGTPAQPEKPAFTERALPWETPKPGQPQAQWHELPGALAEFGKNVWEGIKGAASLPGETYTEGLKGNLPGGLGGTGGPENFEQRAGDLAGLVAGGGKFPAPKLSTEGPKLVQKILSPQSVSPVAEEVAGSIRAAGGQAARDTATTAAQMEPYHAAVNAMPDADRLAFINHVEGSANKSIPEDTSKIHEVFHGTDTPFEHYDVEKLGSNTKAPSAREGFFFSKSAETADAYTNRQPATRYEMSPENRTELERLEANLQKEKTGTSTMSKIRAAEDALNAFRKEQISYAEGSNVRPARLRMDNPFVYDFKGAKFRDQSYSKLIAQAKAAGHDGVIFKNTYDGGPLDDVYVVFDSKQIKGKFEKFDSPKGKLDPKISPLADTLKTEFQKRRTKLEALPSTQQAAFIDDYFPHFWKDPAAAKTFADNYSGGAGKQGSGASLKKRTMPTIADGIAAGLKPLTTDPIEATMRYVSSMDRFIASTSVLDAAKENGTVRYFRPKTMGASGHPESRGSNVAPSGPIPEGWTQLEGRGSTNAMGQTAYAPEDFARVYNNFISKGFHANAEAGKVYDAVQGASNAITSLELGLSGYHAFTMANEAIISDVARGISNVVGGKPIKGVGQIATAAAAPVRSAMRGHKAEQVYLGRSQGTPDMRKVVDLQTQAGGRAVGKGHAADYRFSAMGSYWTAFKRGALKQQMRESMANIKAQPLVGTAKEAGRAIGRVMETVAQPIFEKYIPKIKNGAFYDTMHDWLEANPQAPHEAQVAMARKIWDSIDNRFGEMVQDNIFWNKTLKQTAQLGMRSYSWNLGTAREIGGGALSAIKDPSRLSMASEKYDPRVAYVVAMPIVVATANAAYQYLKTGKAPESVDDLVAGRTGGEAPGFGGRGTVDERASLPGYQKDVLGWYHDWKREILAKQTRAFQIGEELWQGKDYQGHSLTTPDASIPEWLTDYFTHVLGSMVPISVKQLWQGQKTGSNISTPESMMGIRPAPGYIQDSEGTERGMHRFKVGEYKRGLKSQRRQQNQYGGPQE